jgi:endo-1,4-beta-xylanase
VHKKLYPLLLVLLVLLPGCMQSQPKTPVSITPKASRVPLQTQLTQDTSTLRTLASSRGVLIGTAVDTTALMQDSEYASVLGREFSVVTPENVMKFNALEPAPNVYDFKQSDELVAFAQAHAMQVHGHTFVWYRALPDWISQGSFTKAQLSAILHNFITTVMQHYKGEISMWDIANEVLDDNGAFRPSIWYNTLGPDFLDQAFRWAHEADPQVQLFYNDYGTEAQGVKSDALYALVKGMLARGVPIDGVGFQMHIGLNTTLSEAAVSANLQRFADLGLKVQISEMDVMVQGNNLPPQTKLQAQAELYQDMLSACLSVSACVAFTMWGFTDRYTWIPAATGHPDQPLIFDVNYNPKPAYTALFQALKRT